MFDRPFPGSPRIALDIETTGLDWRHDSIVLLTLSDGQRAWSLEPERLDPQALGAWLRREVYDRVVVVHNASFDLLFLHARYGAGFPRQVRDTMVAEQLLTAGLDLSVSLAESVKRRLHLTLDKSLQTSFDGGALSEAQRRYAEEDARLLLPLLQTQEALIQRYQLERVWEIECRATPIFCRLIAEGIHLDEGQLQPLLSALQRQAERLGSQLQIRLTPHIEWQRIQKADAMQHLLDDWLAALEAETRRLEAAWRDESLREQWPHDWDDWRDETLDPRDGQPKGLKRYVKEQLKGWRQEHPRPPKPKLELEPINLDSPAQVQAALEHLGLKLANLQTSTLKIALADAEPALRDEILQPLLDYKRVSKLLSTFGERLREHVSPEGKIHAQVRQIGTATGRPTCSAPNLLQIPAKPEFRRLFRPAPGCLFVIADYSQIELRIMAELSGDPAMVEAFQSGADLHLLTALRMYRDATIQDATLLAVRAGLPTNRAGAEILSTVFKEASAGDGTEELLRSCSQTWQDQETGSWTRGSTAYRTSASNLEEWDRSLQETPQTGVREVQQHALPRRSPQGPEPLPQRPFEFGDALQILSSAGARVLEEFPEWSSRRKIGKVLSFGTLYGMEANKLRTQMGAEGIFLTREEAQQAISQWRKSYQQAWRQIRSWQRQAVEDGFTRTALGRRRHFCGEQRGELERAGGNFPIQGTSADITKLAMILIDSLLAPLGGVIVLQVYDEIVTQIPQRHAEVAAAVVRLAMEEAARTVLQRVPVAVDCVLSDSWDETGSASVSLETETLPA